MHELIQTIINGLTTGFLYALIALGYSMVYGVLKLLNFAHGDVYMVGAYIGYLVLQLFGQRPRQRRFPHADGPFDDDVARGFENRLGHGARL